MENEPAAAVLDLPAPGRCFCQIPLREMIDWARRKYVEGVSTMDLFQAARTPREREIVGIVALLDVPDDDVVRLLSRRASATCNVLACRAHVKTWLFDMLSRRPAQEIIQ